jgi:hypothetical protein
MFDAEIKSAKDYQLQACMNRMKELYKSCSDNLTGEISRTIQIKCQNELKSRGIEPVYY